MGMLNTLHTAILDAMTLILSEASTGCRRGSFDMILNTVAALDTVEAANFPIIFAVK